LACGGNADGKIEVVQLTKEIKQMSKGSGGGGYGSRPHVEKPVRTGSGSHSTNPGYVSQLGNKVGSHTTNKGDSGYRGEIFHDRRDFQPTPFGNEIAARTTCGPGGSRTIYSSGTQGTTGAPASGNPPANRQRDALENE
jgi:hypothetical protein